MTGIITSLPPLIEQPPGNASSNPAGLPGYTYTVALLGVIQTWTAKQTFPLGMISLNAADVLGLTAAIDAEIAAQIGLPLVRVITAAGDVTVGSSDTLIVMNKTVSQVTNVNLPLAALKIGKVKVVDWKGDSDAFPITVNRSGSEKFNATLTSWTISSQGASAVFDPIPTLGYAV